MNNNKTKTAKYILFAIILLAAGIFMISRTFDETNNNWIISFYAFLFGLIMTLGSIWIFWNKILFTETSE